MNDGKTLLNATSIKVEFEGHNGSALSARLDLPAGMIRATALFAHCFTCSKDILAARKISTELARQGIAVLRFDFTGLGSSKGEFAHTNFSSNSLDLIIAADYLRKNYEAPSLLIGHSLGGSAVLVAAKKIPEAKTVCTIGAPSSTRHLLGLFESSLEQITNDGQAKVEISGQSFTIEKQFIEDLKSDIVIDHVSSLGLPYLNLHSPVDKTVGIENATELFVAAKHPKSFVSLDGSDHLLNKESDAVYAARVISGWIERYLPNDAQQGADGTESIRSTETLDGKFQQIVQAGKHRLFGDEPESYGGYDSGLSPYDFLCASLATCTSMTLRVYADFKKLDLSRVSVDVSHTKVHFKDLDEVMREPANPNAKIDQFLRKIYIEDGVPEELESKVLEIADKCPVHKTLLATSIIKTELQSD